MRPMFGAHLPALSIAWVSKAGAEGKVKGYGLKKRVEAVKDCRTVKKSDMKFNDYRPRMKVDPERYVSLLRLLLFLELHLFGVLC
jgi:urease